MPKNNQKKSQPQPQTQPQSQTQTRKAFLLELLKMIGVILVAIAVIVGLFYASWLIKVNNAQGSMKEYLQDKYGKEFKVDRPTLNNGGFGVSGAWSAYAYPDDNKEDGFRVMKSENGDDFADQYTALIWSQRETRRISNVVQNNTAEWKAGVSVSIYLDQPLSEIAVPENPKVEDIIKEESGPSYTVNLHYSEIKPDSIDLIVSDMERITNHIKNEGIRNVNYNYSVVMKNGSESRCSATYNKQFDYSAAGIKNCLSSTKEK